MGIARHGVELAEVASIITDSDVIDLGGRTLALLNLPGHTGVSGPVR